MCILLKRNTQRCLFVTCGILEEIVCDVVLEVAPRLKSTEMNEKMEMESLSRSLSQLD